MIDKKSIKLRRKLNLTNQEIMEVIQEVIEEKSVSDPQVSELYQIPLIIK